MLTAIALDLELMTAMTMVLTLGTAWRPLLATVGDASETFDYYIIEQ